MAELADAKDLGSFGFSVQVRSLLSAPNKNKTNLDENSKFVLFFNKRLFGLKVNCKYGIEKASPKRWRFLCGVKLLVGDFVGDYDGEGLIVAEKV